jgi:hypothetical protein
MERQVALLISRKGEVSFVVVGDDRRIEIPDLGRFRSGTGRLRGLRCIHTHLKGEGLSREDLTDLVLLGLDLMVSVEVNEGGIPGPISYAHILPEKRGTEGWSISRVSDIGQLDVDFHELIQSLENELARTSGTTRLEKKERAILVGVTEGQTWKAKESLEELRDLAVSNNLEVIDVVIPDREREAERTGAEMPSDRKQSPYFRSRAHPCPGQEPHRCNRDENHRPEPAHPRYFCKEGGYQGGQDPGGAGPAEISAAEAGHQEHGHVQVDRRNRG